MTEGSSSDPWLQPAGPRFGRWGAISLLAHVAVFGGLMLFVSREDESAKPERKLVVSEHTIKEVTENIKDLQATQLRVKLDRIREIQGELNAIRDRKREKFGEFAVAVGEVAPENAVDFQQTAVAKMKEVVGQLEALLSQMDEVERTLGELARAGTLEDRESLSTKLEELLTKVRKQQDTLKLTQIESAEAQETTLKRLGFTGSGFKKSIAAQGRVLDMQREADALLDEAGVECKRMFEMIVEYDRNSRALDKARAQLAGQESKVGEAAEGITEKEQQLNGLDAEIAGLKRKLDEMETRDGEAVSQMKKRIAELGSERKAVEKALGKLQRSQKGTDARLSNVQAGFNERKERLQGKVSEIRTGVASLTAKQNAALKLQNEALGAQEKAMALLRKQAAGAEREDAP